MFRILMVTVIFVGCVQRNDVPRPADSSSTTTAVERMQGKTMRSVKGPADILSDTTKNQRSYLKR